MYVSNLPVFSYPVERRAVIAAVVLASAVAITFLVLGILAKCKVNALQHLNSVNTYLLLSLGSILALVIGVGVYTGKAELKGARLQADAKRRAQLYRQDRIADLKLRPLSDRYVMLRIVWDQMYFCFYGAVNYIPSLLPSLYLIHSTRDKTFTFSSTINSSMTALNPERGICPPDFLTHKQWVLLLYLNDKESIKVGLLNICQRRGDVISLPFFDGHTLPTLPGPLVTFETLETRATSGNPPPFFEDVLLKNGLLT